MTDLTDILVGAIQPPSGNRDLGFHMGLITSWDELTGSNVVNVNGADIEDVRVIQSGIGVQLQPGDTVALIRFQTTYFVWGKIAAPGASAATQIRSHRVAQFVNQTPMAFGDLPGSPGPELADVYIGSSRRCLVIHSAEITVSQSAGFQGVQVTGASSIAVETGITDAYLAFDMGSGLGLQIGQSATASTLVTAANGLNQGFNTFTCKYKVTVNGTGAGAIFNNRVLTVIPF